MAPSSSEILYFTGKDCRICGLMEPLVDDAAEEFDGEVMFTEMDAAEFSSQASDYGVMAVPTLIALADGVEIGRSVGAQTPGALKKLFQAASSGEPAEPTMNARDRLLRLMFAVALGVLAISTGQPLVWVLVCVALIAAFWDKIKRRPTNS